MSEEKKEEKAEVKQVEKAEAAAVPQAPQAEAPAATISAQPKAAEKKPEIKKEKAANCAACNKSVKKKRWYYRNGKFYCTKRCWQTTLKKKEDAEAGTTPK